MVIDTSEESSSSRGYRIAVKRLAVDFSSNVSVANRLILQLVTSLTLFTIIIIATSKDLMSSFRREISVLSRFKHPNIVRLIGYTDPDLQNKIEPCLVYEVFS